LSHRGPIAAVTLALAQLLSPPTLTIEPSPPPRVERTPQPTPEEVADAMRWLQPYLEIVRAYREGDTESALKRLRDWWNSGTQSVSWTRLQTISRATKLAAFRGTAPPPISADMIACAVMLHTEAGIEAFDAGDPPLGSEHIGRAVVLLGGFASLIDAEAGHTKPDAARRFTRRAWFQGAAQVLHERWKIEAANAVVDSALEQVRQPDAPLLLAAGSVKEALAFGLVLWPEQANRMRIPEAFGRSSRVSDDPGVHRQRAIELFRRALMADPEMHEASLRLGRVLVLAGRPDEGAQVLEQLLAHKSHAEPPLMYLAHLFLGSVRERRGRLSEALTQYRAAAAIDPNAQVARVALARALELSGDTDAVLSILRPFLEREGLRDPAEDAWWLYPFGQPDEGLRVLNALQAAVTERR
jgi:tetratricopeptide (TPR) repeat protein